MIELSDLHNVSFYERACFPFVQKVLNCKGMMVMCLRQCVPRLFQACVYMCAAGVFPLVYKDNSLKTNITLKDTHVDLCRYAVNQHTHHIIKPTLVLRKGTCTKAQCQSHSYFRLLVFTQKREDTQAD